MAKTKLTDGHPFTDYVKETYETGEMLARSKSFYAWMEKRKGLNETATGYS